MALKIKLHSKKIFMVAILYLVFISKSNGQDLTIRSLIKLAESESYSDFQNSIEKHDFAFYKTEGSPEINIYRAIGSSSSLSFEQVDSLDLCTFSSTKEGIEIGYLTTKKKNADSILFEMNGDQLNFDLKYKNPHPVMEGMIYVFKSEKYPQIIIEYSEVMKNEVEGEVILEKWKSYDFLITQNN